MPNDRAGKAEDDVRWEAHRELLRVLWLEEKKTLAQVRGFMVEYHNFYAEEWVYEAKFRQWNFRKNLPGDAWRIIDAVVGKRKLEGKDSDVFINETLVPSKKVRKETGRKRAQPSGNSGHELPPGVEVRTPKMVASKQIAGTKRRRGKFSRRPLLRNLTALDSLVQNVSECAGANPELLDQQDIVSTSQRMAKDTDIVTTLKKQRGVSFDLEEVMPEPFRIDVSSGFQTLNPRTKKSSAVQMADVALFLISNNLLDDYGLVALIQRILDANHGHIFEKFFTLKSPTIQAYSCRMLERLSATGSWAHTDRILEQLLHYGLDRSILAGPTGGRCLQLAIHNNNEALALLLLRTGAQRNPKLGSKQPFDQAPVNLAILRDQKEVLGILCGQYHKQSHRPFVKLPKNEDELALKKACRNSDFGQIRLLLDGGVDVDCDRYSSSDPILDWAFFVDWQCYDMLLPYSQFAKQFLTVSGLVSAASAGRHELDTYIACKRYPEDDYELLKRVISAGVEHGKTQEIHSILDLGIVSEWLGLEDALIEAARCGDLGIMARLVQLGADSEVFEPLKDEMEECFANAFLDDPEHEDLKILLDVGWCSLEDAFTMNLELMVGTSVSFDGLGNLEFLVEQGLDLDTAIYMKDFKNIHTSLQWTISSGSLEMVKCLIDAGALVNHAAGETSYTALGEAVINSSSEIVKLLLEKGADVQSFANYEDMILLELSVSKYCQPYGDRKEVFQALLEAGADINGPTPRALNTDWNTALTTAIMNPHADKEIRLLLDAGADIHQIGGGRMARTPLQAAAESGRMDILKELLKKGADVNALAAPNQGRTALQAACGSDKRTAEMISLLLDAGADVSAPAAPRYGRTALQALCGSKVPSSELMALLIKRGADINAPPAKYGGITALQSAAIMGNIKNLMILIDMGAYINAPPSECEGRMALDGAAEHGRLDTVQLLLKFGATCVAPGSSGYDSAQRFAEENGHFVIADILQRYNSRVEGEMLDPDWFDGELLDPDWLDSLGM